MEQHKSIKLSLATGSSHTIIDKLPVEAKKWVESLPWKERSYLLSLCHLMCAASPEMQAEFLDDYTANGLLSRRLEDKETQQRVQEHLKNFHINVNLSESVVRSYIKQFYLHSAQDAQKQPNLYLELALRLVVSTEDKANIFNYILGFELIKMIFAMSWLQHERLYQLQIHQEEFFNNYIKPIQNAHKNKGIIKVKDKSKYFFEKRNYFVQTPNLTPENLTELVIETFHTDIVINLGCSVIRNLKALSFDYDYIFNSDQENVFAE